MTGLEELLERAPPKASTPLEVISAWKYAYRSANSQTPPHMWYERGWFCIRYGYVARYRRKQVEGMINTLRFRALSDTKEA